MSENIEAPFRRVSPDPDERYLTCLPLISLEEAAYAFRDSRPIDDSACEWVEIEDGPAPASDLFVAQVFGESMNRRIPNGAWCVWRTASCGTKEGTVILAHHRDVKDREFGVDYTVKIYTWNMIESDYGHVMQPQGWLHPDSDDPAHVKYDGSIVLPNLTKPDQCVAAELVAVLK